MDSTSPYNTSTPTPATKRNRSGRILGGLVIVIVGLVFLADRAGADLPYWIFSFETLLITLGLYLGFRHSFKGFGWAIPIALGVFLLLDDLYPFWDIKDYFWPVVVIAVGLFIMFKPEKKNTNTVWGSNVDAASNSADDQIESVAVFGSVKKNIISKTFRGGEATTIFGGTEINLTQADVQGPITLELTNVFAGTKLIVPPNWKVQTEEVVAILGGVEDKRAILSDPSSVDHQKVLILRGTCIFGGIDIKSF